MQELRPEVPGTPSFSEKKILQNVSNSGIPEFEFRIRLLGAGGGGGGGDTETLLKN